MKLILGALKGLTPHACKIILFVPLVLHVQQSFSCVGYQPYEITVLFAIAVQRVTPFWDYLNNKLFMHTMQFVAAAQWIMFAAHNST